MQLDLHTHCQAMLASLLPLRTMLLCPVPIICALGKMLCGVWQVREVTSTRFAAIKETLEGMASAESVDLLRAEQDRLRQAAAKLVVDLTTLRVSL